MRLLVYSAGMVRIIRASGREILANDLSQTKAIEDRSADGWRGWLWRPKNTWIRKAVFQLHLWFGMLLGLYVAVVCASGSAIVFRNDIYDWLESGGKAFAYKGLLYHWLSWLGKLHGSLLMDSDGMTANAVGGFLLAGLCLSGMVVWWPGVASWPSALTIKPGLGWKRLVFDLHRAVGFWTFAVLLMWGVTGGYFVFPQPFRAAIGIFTPMSVPVRGHPLPPGPRILRGFSYAHYGNFAGWPVKLLWVILGLAPVALYSTALIMWWNRVLIPAMRRRRRGANKLNPRSAS